MPREAKTETTMDYRIEIRFWSYVDKDKTQEMFRKSKQLKGQVYIKGNKELGIEPFCQTFGPTMKVDLMRATIMAQDHLRLCVEDN